MSNKVILRVTDLKKDWTSIFIVDEEQASSVIQTVNNCPVKIYLASQMETEPIPNIKIRQETGLSDYARYFDIKSVFECCPNINPECIHFLAEEAAFVEEYCDHILDLCEKLASDIQTVEIAKRISDTILSEAVEILKEHMRKIEENYHAFHNKIHAFDNKENRVDIIDIDVDE